MSEQTLIREDVVAYLARHERKTLLRFVIVGSVDDGKSTLVGRLLYDTANVFDDQLAAVRTASKLEDGSIDLSLLTDGLAAEREQGITIDVAYRYFSTESRKFIVADTPGHVQYTRNMVTGASTADVAIILIDARMGVLEQSRRHSYIASLLGIPRLLVAVNKMDLKEYSQGVFEDIRRDFDVFARRLRFQEIAFVPVSAYKGDNVAEPSSRMPWYTGKTVLRFLEEVPVEADLDHEPLRYPVQYVNRPNLDFRGFCGQVASGVVKKGDTVMVLPSGKTSTVKAIDTADDEVDEAFAPLSVTLRLDDEVDCSRGDMIVHPDARPDVARRFEADLVWMHERPLDTRKTYLIKHTTQTARVQVERVTAKVDLATIDEMPFGAGDALEMNDIARVTLTCHRPLYLDAYTENRTTGAFILVDSLYNATVAAGMVLAIAGAEEPQSLYERGEALAEHRELQQDIGELVVRCATGIDRRDWGLFRSCFTDDCAADYGKAGRWDSGDSITASMREVYAALGVTLHRITNTAVTRDADVVTARSYVDALVLDLDAVNGTQVTGYYDDTLVKTDDGWKIRRRIYTTVRTQVLKPG